MVPERSLAIEHAFRNRIIPATAEIPVSLVLDSAFAGTWALERVVAVGIAWPALAERVIDRLAQRPSLAAALVGACGNVLPARAALAPRALAGMVW